MKLSTKLKYIAQKIAKMDPLEMGDLVVVDREGLGVDFRERYHPEKGNLTFVNDMGADALGDWLITRKYHKEQEEAKKSKNQKMSAQEIADKMGYDIKLVEAILGSSDLGTTDVNTVAKWLKIDPRIVEKVYFLAF